MSNMSAVENLRGYLSKVHDDIRSARDHLDVVDAVDGPTRSGVQVDEWIRDAVRSLEGARMSLRQAMRDMGMEPPV
jgi:hypothetical protein